MAALFDRTTNVLSTALDLYLLRHSVITDNIANAETPGFKARRVDFEKQLQGVLEKHNKKAIPKQEGVVRSLASVKPLVYEDTRSEVGQDRNSVDMDREMAALAKNDVKYSATTQSIVKKFSLLKYAISEGQR